MATRIERRKIARFLTAAGCALLLGSCGGGGGGSAGIDGFTVRGKIVDERLRPVPGIALALSGQFDTLIGRQTSNLAGEFKFVRVFDDKLSLFFDFPAEVPDRLLPIEFKDEGDIAQIDVRLETDGDVDIDLIFTSAPDGAADDAGAENPGDEGTDSSEGLPDDGTDDGSGVEPVDEPTDEPKLPSSDDLPAGDTDSQSPDTPVSSDTPVSDGDAGDIPSVTTAGAEDVSAE